MRTASSDLLNRARGRLARELERVARVVHTNTPVDPLRELDEILVEPHGASWESLSAREQHDAYDVQWVIPAFGPSSGGHLNIFRFVSQLADRGYRQRLVTMLGGWHTVADCRRDLTQWYGDLPVDVGLGVADFRPAHATFATGWQTAFAVARHRASAERLYFIQDFEPAFYPASTESILADRTYSLDLIPVTAGPWLADTLSDRYSARRPTVTSFGCDDPLLRPTGDPLAPRSRSGPLRILFYSRHYSPRRMFTLGLSALAKVAQARDDVEVVFAGGDTSTFSIPFRHENVGRLEPHELPALYKTLDLALVLGATNLSLLPGELVASGCPVVLNDGANNRWLLNDSIAYFAAPEPVALADRILDALNDPVELAARRRRGVEWSTAMKWSDQVGIVVDLLQSLRASTPTA